ncbi:MAG: efflux RND transporter periplasmic adaptor subunit [Candidatus Pacebacteria bacterium]|jgi:RND family efflux transporter MFP subunit|nr:efflux RND transporter periplasmic adaptor subunit [Candidatus Paceibacterota bacterium]
MNVVKKYYQMVRAWFLGLSVKKRVLTAGFAVLALVVLGNIFTGSKETAIITETPDLRAVVLASVSTLANDGSPLALSGEVRSVSEANIKTEATGRVTNVYKKIGDTVFAGEIIAEIENSREAAALTQAKALLAQTKASQNISEIGQQSSATLLEEARNSAVNTLRSTYDGTEDIIRNKLDPMFSNPELGNPVFSVTSNNSQNTTDTNFARLKVQNILTAQQERKAKLSAKNDLLVEIKITETELAEIKKLIDLVNTTLNTGLATMAVSQTTIDAYKVTASTARTSWNTLMAGLSTAKDNLTSKTASYEIAQKQGSSTSNMLTTGEAAIAQAESGVALAQVAFEKTIVRSPIFGSLNSLPITRGDYVSQSQPAATVSNNNALEIVAYITASDSKEISVGNKVEVGEDASGVVTRIAPALDPLTKKIEVRIGVSKGLGSLLNGQSVSISIERTGARTGAQKDSDGAITIPIVSLKITPDGPVVFTVENETLKAHAVTIGSLLGNRIMITDGLTPAMEIVTDARGLKDGQKVIVK